MSKLPHLLVTLLVVLIILMAYWTPVNKPNVTPLEHWNHTEPKLELNGCCRTSFGYLWPRRNDVNDRIENQVEFLKHYRSNRTLPMKTILRVGDFNFEGVENGQKVFIDERCPVAECRIINDKKLASTADVVVISQFSHESLRDYIPKPVNQIWIAQHWESAMHDRIDTRAVQGLINWTASYRRDATIPISYGKYRAVNRSSRTDNSSVLLHRNYAKGKTKKVAWFVSNCDAKNNRWGYAHKLGQYISVDVYGWCGWKKCPRDGEHSCKNLLKNDYKFYLAFENSNCKDYITEKLTHNAFKNDVLPIVMGARREDYAAVSPPRSYIHVDDFEGPHELAAYLNQLDADDALYNSYFEWKNSWEMMDIRYWCRVCMMLHLRDEEGFVMWYDDYHWWWNSVCGQTVVRSQTFFVFLGLVLTSRLQRAT